MSCVKMENSERRYRCAAAVQCRADAKDWQCVLGLKVQFTAASARRPQHAIRPIRASASQVGGGGPEELRKPNLACELLLLRGSDMNAGAHTDGGLSAVPLLNAVFCAGCETISNKLRMMRALFAAAVL